MNHLLECNDLCKTYDSKFYAIDHLTLQIPRGKIIGLLGPNGSGKTTLIKMISGLLTPTEGDLLIDGIPPSPESKLKIAYLPERNYLNDNLNVFQIIHFFQDFYENFSQETAFHLLDMLKISGSSRMKTLSKGNREKVQLILVMSRTADLYILDEPIAGVDPAARDYILKTILQNYNPNGSILISTHLISDIENILDEVIFLKYGKLVSYSSVDDLREKQNKSIDSYFREVFSC